MTNQVQREHSPIALILNLRFAMSDATGIVDPRTDERWYE